MLSLIATVMQKNNNYTLNMGSYLICGNIRKSLKENGFLSGEVHYTAKSVHLEAILFFMHLVISSFLLPFLFLPPTQGLCGNFNNIQTDDFRTVTGAVEDSASAFGNSWKTRASCFDVEDSFEDPCSNSVDKGTRLFIRGLSVRNNFHMMDNQKSFRNLINIKPFCL